MEYSDLTFEDFKKTFKSVKRNKAAGHNDIDSNVIIKFMTKLGHLENVISHYTSH